MNTDKTCRGNTMIHSTNWNTFDMESLTGKSPMLASLYFSNYFWQQSFSSCWQPFHDKPNEAFWQMTSCEDMTCHPLSPNLGIWTAFKMSFRRGAFRLVYSKSILFPKWKSDKTGSTWQHREASLEASVFTGNRLKFFVTV